MGEAGGVQGQGMKALDAVLVGTPYDITRLAGMWVAKL